MHELIVVRRLVLVILHVPSILEVILDFFGDMMVLEWFETSKSRVICLRHLRLAAEPVNDGIQIVYWVRKVMLMVCSTHSRLLTATFLAATSALHLLLCTSSLPLSAR